VVVVMVMRFSCRMRAADAVNTTITSVEVSSGPLLG